MLNNSQLYCVHHFCSCVSLKVLLPTYIAGTRKCVRNPTQIWGALIAAVDRWLRPNCKVLTERALVPCAGVLRARPLSHPGIHWHYGCQVPPKELKFLPCSSCHRVGEANRGASEASLLAGDYLLAGRQRRFKVRQGAALESGDRRRPATNLLRSLISSPTVLLMIAERGEAKT